MSRLGLRTRHINVCFKTFQHHVKTPYDRTFTSPYIIAYKQASSIFGINSARHYTSLQPNKSSTGEKSDINPVKNQNTPAKITKNLLLAQASNRLSRILVHIKWPLTRNNRPFSIDDFSAFVSWVVMGNLLWIVLGTTTFVLCAMYALNLADIVSNIFGIGLDGSVSHDDSNSNSNSNMNPNSNSNTQSTTKTIAKSKSNIGFLNTVTGCILSSGFNVNVEFEKGSVLPQFNDGMLIFKDINLVSKNDQKVKANIQKLKVSLSFSKWYEGKGLINELEIFGMTAKIYKSNSMESKAFTEEDKSTASTSSFRYNESSNFHHYDDEQTDMSAKSSVSIIDPNYTIAQFKMRDSYFEIYDESEHEKPLKISIFNCDIPELHGDRLLVDFFGSNNVTGAINDSMFTIHKHQRYSSDENRMVRCKLDGIDLGSITKRHSSSKFSWIMQGKADIVADILLPQSNKPQDNIWGIEYRKIVSIFSETFNALFPNNGTNENISTLESIPTDDVVDQKLLKSSIAAIYDTFSANHDSLNDIPTSEYVMVDIKLKLHNLKACLPKQLPMANTSIPFISLYDLRTLIAFVNNYFEDESKPPLIIKSTAIEKLADLNNLSHLTETNLFNLIVGDIYEDLIRMAEMEDKRIMTEKSNMWSHSLASQLLLLGLGVLA